MPNYRVAAERHLRDGDILFAEGRHINASHLWAYGAECVLKAILYKKRVLQLDANGMPVDKTHKKHINDKGNPLLGAYQSAMSGHATYLLPTRSAWFAGWDINQRYEDGLAVSAQSTSHSTDKQVFQNLLAKAIQEGYV